MQSIRRYCTRVLGHGAREKEKERQEQCYPFPESDFPLLYIYDRYFVAFTILQAIHQNKNSIDDIVESIPFLTREELISSARMLSILKLVETDFINELPAFRITRRAKTYINAYQKMAKIVKDVYLQEE